jgi:hypothetical protein
MARSPSPSKKGGVTPLDPAVVNLIDAVARSLAREDDAREQPAAGRIIATPLVTTGRGRSDD